MLFRNLILRLFFLTALFLSTYDSAEAQVSGTAPIWKWTKVFPVSNDSNRIWQLIGEQGHLYGWGTFTSSSFSIDNQYPSFIGEQDLFVAKWDTLGNLVWIKSISGNGMEQGINLAMDSYGDLVLGGNSTSSTLYAGGDTLISHGDKDLFIVKIDTIDGHIIWANNYGNAGTDYMNSFCVGNGDMIYAAASYNGINGIIAFQGNGSVVWAKDIQNTPEEIHYSAYDNSIISMGTYYTVPPNAVSSFTIDGVTIQGCGDPLYYTLYPFASNYMYKMTTNHSMIWLKNISTSCEGNRRMGFQIVPSTGKIICGDAFDFGIGCCNWHGQMSIRSANGGLVGSYPTSYFSILPIKISPISLDGNFMTYNVVYGAGSINELAMLDIINDSVESVYSFPQTGNSEEYSISPAFYNSSIFVGGDGTDSNIGHFSFGQIITSIPTMSVSIASVTRKCRNQIDTLVPTILGGNPPYIYSWSPSLGLSSPDSMKPMIVHLQNITYTLTVTDAYGTTASGTRYIATDTIFQAEIITNDSLLCNDSLILKSNFQTSLANGYWLPSPMNLGSLTSDSILASIAGLYTLYKINGVCPVTYDSIRIKSLPLIGLDILPDSIACRGDSLSLFAYGAMTYSWSNGVINGMPFKPIENTTYTVTATDAAGCISTSTTYIYLNTPGLYQPVSSICEGDSIMETVTYDTDSLSWTFNGILQGAVPVGYDVEHPDTILTSSEYIPVLKRGSDQNIYLFVSDAILKWRPDSNNAVIVAGGHGIGIGLNQLRYPMDMCIDQSGDLIILDQKPQSSKKRISRWRNGEMISSSFISEEDLNSIEMDQTGKFYAAYDFHIDQFEPNVGTIKVVAKSIETINNIYVDASGVIYTTNSQTNKIKMWIPGDTNVILVPTPVFTNINYIGAGSNGDLNVVDGNSVYSVKLPFLYKDEIFQVSELTQLNWGRNTIDGNGDFYYLNYWNNTSSVIRIKARMKFHITNNQPGTYTVFTSSEMGCSNNNTFSFEVNSIPQVLALASDTVICYGNSVVLNGNGAYSYMWSDSVINSIPFQLFGDETFNVIGVDTNGCTNSDSIHITVLALPPQPSIHYSPPNHFSTASPGTLQWYYNNTPVPGDDTVDYLGNGIYQVKVTDSNGCERFSQPYSINISDDWYINPNPFTDYILITLHVPENEIISWTIFDLQGNTVLRSPDQLDVVKGIHELRINNLGNLAHGVYFLQVILSEERRVFKVVK